MAEDRGTLAKLATLQTKMLECIDQQRAIAEEMGKLLAGGPGVGVILKRLERHFSECWQVRYRAAYVFTYAKDVPQMKRLLRTLSVEEIERRMLAFLKADDPFYLKARHSFGVFVHAVNDLAPVASAAPAIDLELQREADDTDALLQRMRPRS